MQNKLKEKNFLGKGNSAETWLMEEIPSKTKNR
jgi:hypothetical protein